MPRAPRAAALGHGRPWAGDPGKAQGSGGGLRWSPPCPRSWKPVADYIDQQFEQYFRDESGLNRKNIQDNRVHCCIYFISPFGHGYGQPLPVLPG